MTLANGTRLGPYEIVAPIAAGGMGEVYRARDTKLDRDVAVKVLPAHLTDDPEALARLEREAKAVAALSHPNILAIHDFGEISGVTFAVLELLEGETLRERLAPGPLPVRKALDLGSQIARGLAAAHERGIVHRDLKPENVFVTRDGHAKILDFGLAKQGPAVESGSTKTLASPSPSATEAGTVLGTAGYMAPEQVRGLPADHRSDIFAFGAILYEMLAGRRAFAADSGAEVMAAILHAEPPDIASAGTKLPPALDQFVHRCLEKNPNERFQSARDLAFGLEAIATGTASGSGSRAAAGTQRRRFPVVPAGAAALLALGFAIGFAAERRTHRAGLSAAAGVRQLTFAPGEIGEPAVSPDGGSFVYVAGSGGTSEIFLQRVGGQNPISLTPGEKKTDTQPAFSPDGNQIAFRSERDGGGIFLMGATGENRRRLTDFGFDPAWSPDGKEIVVSTEGVMDPLARSGTGALVAIDVATGAKRRVFEGDAVQPSWSPHGARIAYWALPKGSGQRDIWTVPAAGESAGAPVPVTSDAPTDWNPVWSPTGDYLYFGSDRGGSFNIWRVPIDERSGKALGAPEPVTVPATTVGRFCLLHDGKTILFQSRHYNAVFAKIPFDPLAGRPAGQEVPLFRSTVLQLDPDLSPDGSTLVMRTQGSKEDLFVLRTDGTGLRKLTDDAFRNRGPSWSPDGTRIAFYSNRSGHYDLWTINADGSGLTAVTRGAGRGLWYPRWSPDGRLLSSPDGTGSYLVRADAPAGQAGLEPLPPLGRGLWFQASDWSPDGRMIVGSATTDAGQSRGLAVYSLATRTYETVSDSGATPRWLNDGRRVLFNDQGSVWLLDLRTKQKRVAIAPGPNESIDSFVTLTRDNRTVYAIRTLVQADVWLSSMTGVR